MSRHLRRSLLAILGTGLVAALAAATAPLLYPHFEPASWWYPVTGVDVSNHQGEIDWQALASSGIGFAYIKATEGETFRDKSFARNWSEADRAGVPRGAYHFFTLCRSAAEQAKNFIDTVPKDPKALPPVVDAEHMGPCTWSATIEDHAAELTDFIDMLERHYGRRPLVYTTAEYDGAMLSGVLEKERFWARSLVVPPLFRRSQWVIWQYHNRGRRPGVSGDIDLNVFRGTREEFDSFASGADLRRAD